MSIKSLGPPSSTESAQAGISIVFGDFFLIVKTDRWFAALGVTHEEVDVSSPACGTTCEAAKGAAKHGAAPRHLALSTSAQLFSRARVTQIIPTVKVSTKYCGNFNNI